MEADKKAGTEKTVPAFILLRLITTQIYRHPVFIRLRGNHSKLNSGVTEFVQPPPQARVNELVQPPPHASDVELVQLTYVNDTLFVQPPPQAMTVELVQPPPHAMTAELVQLPPQATEAELVEDVGLMACTASATASNGAAKASFVSVFIFYWLLWRLFVNLGANRIFFCIGFNFPCLSDNIGSRVVTQLMELFGLSNSKGFRRCPNLGGQL